MPTAADEVAQDGPDALARHRVDRLERLVEHEQPRGVDQRAGQPDLLGHAGRVLHDQGVAVGGQPQRLEQFPERRAICRPAPCAAGRRSAAARRRSAGRTAADRRGAPPSTPWPRPGRPRRRGRAPGPCRCRAAAAQSPSTAWSSCRPRSVRPTRTGSRRAPARWRSSTASLGPNALQSPTSDSAGFTAPVNTGPSRGAPHASVGWLSSMYAITPPLREDLNG